MQTLTTFFEQFHFIRPLWLLALVPAIFAGIWLIKKAGSGSQSEWHQHVDAHLLVHLMVQKPETRRSSWLPVLALIAVLTSIVGVAGPTWKKANVPAFTGTEPTVVVLSLAQSMNATDVSPSRLQRAIHKVKDILQATEGDERALVIYADTPFTAAPLTTDANVITQMLPELSTSLMPVLGNRLDLAISEASELLNRGKTRRGRIVILADNAGDNVSASISAAKNAERNGFTVSVIGVGTEKGSDLTTHAGQAITDNSGHTMTTQLKQAELKEVANAGAGVYLPYNSSDAQIKQLVSSSEQAIASGLNHSSQTGSDTNTLNNIKADKWQDMGFWLLLIPVLCMPMLFKRGFIFVFAMLTLGSMGTLLPQPAYAASSSDSSWSSRWSNLWSTPNQQAQKAFNDKDYSKAAKTFKNEDWQASANYKAGNYQAAAKGYQQTKESYNLGNALAKSGDLQGALNAYDAALKQNPNHANAKFNRDLVEKLLKQQQNKQKNQKQDKQKQQKNGQQKQGKKDAKNDQKPSDSKSQKDQQGKNPNDQKQNGKKGDEQKKKKQPTQNQHQKSHQDAQKPSSKQDAGKEKQQANKQPQKPKKEKPEQQREQQKKQQSKQGQKPSNATQSGQMPAQRQKLDQASAQKLRKVPDDPTGLLRARIRQHYMNQYAKQQQNQPNQ